MKTLFSKIALTAALALAIALTLASCAKQVHVDGGSGRGNAKLLESITDYYGNVIEKFEYDKQKRLVKRIGYTLDEDGNIISSSTTVITYSGKDLITVVKIDSDNSKSVTKYTITGNIITRESDGQKDTIDQQGYAITRGGGKYEYKDGNLISEKLPNDDACDGCEDVYTYTYDDKKSPFSNCATPKWLIPYIVGFEYATASKNNLLSSFFDNGNEGGGRNFEYIYDDDGFPRLCTTTYSGEGADDNYNVVTLYVYSGNPAEETAWFNAVVQAAKEARADRAKAAANENCVDPNCAVAKETFTDSRDGKSYKKVKIGDQTWMAENLNYQADEGSWCYNDESISCDITGRLYDWETARTVCPAGFHLPSNEEWNVLVEAAGGNDAAGTALKARSGWSGAVLDDGSVRNGDGTDDFGFSALPGGFRDFSDGKCHNAGTSGVWWTATERGSGDNAYNMGVYFNHGGVVAGDSNKNYGGSVRCIAD